MLYSIGYQGKNIDFIIEQLRQFRIEFLVDVRSKPYSRDPQFNKKALHAAVEKEGIAYIWSGQILGGLAKIAEKDIKELAEWQTGIRACLMCMEANPKECHRHYEIARRLQEYNVTINHIYKREW